MKLVRGTPTLFVILVACGGPSSSTSPATAPSASAAAATAAIAPASSAPTTAATTTTTLAFPGGRLTIPNPSLPGDKTQTLAIDAPAGATATVNGATVNVVAGERFAIDIAQGSGDLHEVAKSLGSAQSTVQKAHVEKIKDDVLIYTGDQLGRGGYHFEALVSTSNPKNSYSCSDSGLLKTEITRADVDAMIRACKSIAAK